MSAAFQAPSPSTPEIRLRQMQEEAEQFASQICHDVEEPLRAMTAFAQLMEEKRWGPIDENEQAYLRHVLASTDHVRRLLRGFLSYCQAGRSNHSRFGPVDLRIAAASALQTLRRRANDMDAEIQVEESLPVVLGDFAELQQVLEHLIGNALTHRRPGSTPSVRISAQRTGPDVCTVSVMDNGPGVAPERLALLFLPFKRFHGREIPGAGLGLAISRRIVEWHGGHIWCEAAEGGGARFCMTLPLLESNVLEPNVLESSRLESIRGSASGAASH